MSDVDLNPRGEDPSQPGATLPDPLASVLRDPVNEKSVPRMWRRIEERRARQQMPFGVVLGWALLGAAVALVTLFAVNLVWEKGTARALPPPGTEAGPLYLKGGGPIVAVEVATAANAVPVDLTDGSHLVVEGGSRLEPLVSSDREVVLRLVRGRASFQVTPGGPRRWVIEAGLASVEVVGTRFSVVRRLLETQATVRVEVEHGIVLVRGQRVPDGVARLEAGGSIDVVEPLEAPPAAAATTAVRPDLRPKARSAGSAAETVPATATVWRDAVAHGKYGDAYASLGTEGVARETERAASADDLFALADVARLSGHPTEAVDPLERLLARYPSSARASLAAVSLGRIELGLGQAAKASATLERALALGVPSGLEEDVRARLVEAYVKTGNREAAREAGREYARRFPGGRRSADIARWLSR